MLRKSNLSTVDHILRYLPGMTNISYQGTIYIVKQTKYKQIQHIRILEFNIRLRENQYIVWISVHVCLPIQIKAKIDLTDNVPAGTMNNCKSFLCSLDKLNRY